MLATQAGNGQETLVSQQAVLADSSGLGHSLSAVFHISSELYITPSVTDDSSFISDPGHLGHLEYVAAPLLPGSSSLPVN